MASQGGLQIELVVAIAALAAIIVDNAGYLISRRFGRTLLERPGLLERRRRRVLEIGEPFFERHGPKAVFFGRWILGLRTWASWPAGASKMPWRSFAVWNAAGAISWATTVGLVAYLVGNNGDERDHRFRPVRPAGRGVRGRPQLAPAPPSPHYGPRAAYRLAVTTRLRLPGGTE